MGDGAQRAVAILAPGHCAVKYQRADAAKEPVRSFFSCEPAGTMHVKCEWYVARTDHGYVAQARASGAKDPLEGRQQRRKRRTIIMCARRKEATAPDAVRRSGTHSASPLEILKELNIQLLSKLSKCKNINSYLIAITFLGGLVRPHERLARDNRRGTAPR